MNGRIVVDDARYRVIDYEFGDCTISKTELHKDQRTKGHSHPSEEVMIFLDGYALLKLGNEIPRQMIRNDIVFVEPNQFHQVFTIPDRYTTFVSIFKGKREEREAKY